jgi:hypothetical protein
VVVSAQASPEQESCVIRVLLPFALAIATVAACSLLYNPDHLSGGSSNPDGDLGRGVVDAATDPDATTPSDSGTELDAVRDDAAMVDAGSRDAAGRDAAVDATAIDAAPIDAAPPDAPSCGATDQPCCPGNACEEWNECTAGACRACGALLQSCCDPGASCRLGLCVAGVCVSLAGEPAP